MNLFLIVIAVVLLCVAITCPIASIHRTVGHEFAWLCRQARAPRFLTMAEWAERYIIVPDGPRAGRPFRIDRQPFTRLWFAAVDSGRWIKYVATGPQQSGKTLCCFVIPILYHLFEIKETVLVGLPDMNMANDKWREDLLPAIEASPELQRLLPERGEGSRGGIVKSAVKFRHGVTLRFMSGGGKDKKRAGFTARVLVITETDGMDEAGSTSREADKISQLEGRTRAYSKRTGPGARIYMECTVSIEKGRTWREYVGGTESRIMTLCPHCNHYVSLERADLVGWQDAENVIQAREGSRFVCSNCGEVWNYEDRRLANENAVLLHRGQRIAGADDPQTWEAGVRVVGDPPETDTLGFRWSPVNNLLVDAGDVGAEEWKARLDPDPENAERKLLQFVWALPYRSPDLELTPLDAEEVKRRVSETRRGFVPEGCTILTVGLDTGKWKCHWNAIAWRPDGTGFVVDYGIFEPDSRRLGTDRALMHTLQQLRQLALRGWPRSTGEIVVPKAVTIDSGWHEHKAAVYAFCRQCRDDKSPIAFVASKGYGRGQRNMRPYTAPTQRSRDVRGIGLNYHLTYRSDDRLFVFHVNADYWKTQVHEACAKPADEPRSLHLFEASPSEHHEFVRQLTAEQQVETYDRRSQELVTWERVYRHNHWLDATYNAFAVAHYCGIKPEATEARHRNVRDWFGKTRKQRALAHT